MSNVSELTELLELTKSIAANCGQQLINSFPQDQRTYVHASDIPKEVKAVVDTTLENYILERLRPTGLSVLTEESGHIPATKASPYWFIVDPLDGTFNFVKGLGPSAVSIALWNDQKPMFGVIFDLAERQLYWGGARIGAYADGQRIFVSNTSDTAQASICTGFPSRFDFEPDSAMNDFWQTVKPYAKVRMLGSAAVSLLHVAKGSTDTYSEKNIMLWDVAAGLAIVEGAGGVFSIKTADHPWSYMVVASNAHLLSTRSA